MGENYFQRERERKRERNKFFIFLEDNERIDE